MMTAFSQQPNQGYSQEPNMMAFQQPPNPMHHNQQQFRPPPFQQNQPPPFQPQSFQQQQNQNHPPPRFQQQNQPQFEQQRLHQPPPQQNQEPPLRVRILLSRDEAGYLFGYDGILLNQLRQNTGADIILTDPVSPDQILILSGTLDLIFKAFSLVCRKLWDFLQEIHGPGSQRPLVIKLAVHSSQCGSIIGKSGAKVKEIRDMTGANIQVSQDSLPDSSERVVEISGSGEACLQCSYQICVVLQDSVMRGEYVPYNPKPVLAGPGGSDFKPVFLCSDKAYVIEGNYAVPAPPELLKQELAKTTLGEMAESLNTLDYSLNSSVGSPQELPAHMNPLVLIQAIGNSKRNLGEHKSREMTISSEMVGFIIGKGGSKITEIRRISGAQLHINQDDDTPAEADRVVTISGTEESILIAQFLIQSNIDIAMKDRNSSTGQFDEGPANNQANGRFGGRLGSGGAVGGGRGGGGFRGGGRRGRR